MMHLMFRPAAPLLAFLFVLSLGTAADVTRYDRVGTRRQLLDLARNPPRTGVKLVGELPADPRVQHFLNYYLAHVHPVLDRARDLELKRNVYEMLIMTNSQTSPAELNRWRKKMSWYESELNAQKTDRAYTTHLKELVHLGKSLSGNLPKRVRRLLKARLIEEFDPSAKPLLDELGRRTFEFQTAQRKAPANVALPDFNAARTEVELAFKTGRLPFNAALNRLRALYAENGPHVVGAQAADAAGEALDRAAVLRSQLARTKGFRTWAEYRLAENGAGYEARFFGPANQIKFLTDLREGLRRPFNTFIDRRLRELGLTEGDVPEYALELLRLPTFEAVAHHFPGAEITNMWQQTAYESGFDESTFKQMLVDDGVREGKNTNIAFMNMIVEPAPADIVINQSTLHVHIPTVRSLRPGLVLIYQSYQNEGVNDLEMASHEGGHSIDFLLRHQHDPTLPQAYGTTEVPSMTYENFVRDPEVLYARAVSINGVEPTLAELKIMATNARTNRITDLVRWVTQSLFDIEVWNHNYDAKGSVTFRQRVAELARKYDITLGRLPSGNLPISREFKWVSTNHFVSGNVRYSGYVFAEVGARMVTSYITDQLQARTGRASWYQQPQFADIFVNDVVRNLWRTKFPANVETITGKAFSTTGLIAEYERLVGCGYDLEH